MVRFRDLVALTLAFASFAVSALAAPPASTVYKLGDLAQEDVITPVTLQVIDPEATAGLRKRLADEVLLTFRYAPTLADKADGAIRQSVATAKNNFLTTLRHALNGTAAQASEIGSPAYVAALRIVAGELPADFPLEPLAALWVAGQPDDKLIDGLVQPVRDVMLQPIVANKTDVTLPSNQQVQLIPVASLETAIGAQDLKGPVTKISSGRILSLWRARRLVETSGTTGSNQAGKFAATFVQPNAAADQALTEVLRAQRTEGVTANDTYEAAQVIVRKGQLIDRKALAALTALREKNTIGALQSKLAEEQTLATQISQQTLWIAGGLGVVCLGLLLILWRLRANSLAALALPPQPLGLPTPDVPALAESSNEKHWRERALLAEGKAERAHAAIKSGALGWMRERLFQSLFRQRADLLTVQKKAEREMGELEQRLESLHTPLQERIRAYETRIEELERELAAKGEANRELIGARIAVTRQQLKQERERGGFGSN